MLADKANSQVNIKRWRLGQERKEKIKRKREKERKIGNKGRKVEYERN